MVFLLGICAIAFYFLPWIVAIARNHHNCNAIGLTTLLLGWTVLGWVIALIWAATAVRPAPETGK